ncbi:MAG: hypothetical protein Q8M29_04895 [Bacteroidota bacterium]|nr:hypothetical protein [Bacteroidota bacterium]
MLYEVTIGIEAPNEQQATEITQALLGIVNNLSVADLKDLAKLLKENPGIVQKAKKYLG